VLRVRWYLPSATALLGLVVAVGPAAPAAVAVPEQPTARVAPTVPVGTAPVEPAPIEPARVEPAPVVVAPIEPARGEPAPVEVEPIQPARVEPVPAAIDGMVPRPPWDRTPPDAVTGLRAGSITPTSATLAWATPLDDVAEVLVRRAVGEVAPANPGQGAVVPLGDPTASTVLDSGLSPSSAYSWAVFTRDAAGNTSAAVAVSARTAAESPLVGYDVSWPQCGETLPAGPAFAVVGVNGGLANTTNPCLAEQLAWAQAAGTGLTEQPTVALYVNTANPAQLGTSWPESDFYPAGAPAPVANPYGECTAGDYAAPCAFMYGYARAYDDATIRGVPDPASRFWWLDVELGNSWQADTRANRAVLEGMTHYLRDVLGAAGVGIYATTYQWGRIVGQVGPVPGSNLNGLPSWIPGATTLAGAQAACAGTPLTGGEITLTQYVHNDLDHNHACAPEQPTAPAAP
jgi:hypothetical protein